MSVCSDASQLCLLVSYIDPFAASDTTTPLSPRSFALLTLDATSPTSSPIVSSITKLSHRAIHDPRPGTSGLLALSSTTSAAFVVLGDAVVAVSREPGSTLEEVVSLKETVVNRVIGFGHPRTPRQDGIPEVSVVTTASGLLKVEVNPQALVGQATYAF